MTYSLSKYEQETHITWNAEDGVVSVWTCIPATISKLGKLVSECPEAYKCLERGSDFAKYQTASKFIRFAKPASEAQRETRRRKRMAQLRTSEAQREG